MVDLRAIIDNLNNMGFYSVFLPFILVYVVVFAILEKSGIFSKDSDSSQTKNINAVIAFVFGLFVVASINTVMYIQSLITNVVLFIIFILVVLILLGFIFGKEYIDLLKQKNVKWTIFGLITIICTALFLKILGFWEWMDTLDLGNSDDWITWIVIGGIILFMYWITKSDNGNNKKEK